MTVPNDPFMLLSMVNMKLRDEYPSFNELCASEGLDPKLIAETLAKAGFEYLPAANQFR